MTVDPSDPSDPSTGTEDSGPEGRRPAFTWLVGLALIVGALVLVSLVISLTGGSPPPSR